MFRKKEGATAVVGRRPKKKIKVWKIVALAVVVLIVIRGVVGMFFGGEKEFIPSVDTAEVLRGDITSTLDTSGTIASEMTRVYASPINAQVGEIPVAPGEKVLKGDYLLTYDTASLQKSYDIAELQAKAEDSTGRDSLAKSSESASDLATSANDIRTLQGQIDAVNAEISSLQGQATSNEIANNNNAAINEEIARLQAQREEVNARIAALETKKEQKTISDHEREELKELRKQLKAKENEIDQKQKSLRGSAEIANNLTNIQAQLTQKNSQLAELQSKLAEAQSKNASAEAGILTEAARANINYTMEASKLTMEKTADDLSRAKAGVTADFDGIVTEVAASPGTIAAEGTPLVTLASANDMCVEVSVSKYNLMNIKTGQTATVTFQDKEYQGAVSHISKLAQKTEANAAMVTIKVHIDAPDDNLILGLDAKVSVDLGAVNDVLVVPVTAVNSDTQGDFVYIVENNMVVKKYVTTGMASKEEIEVKSGIDQGEKVITTVDSTIMEGMAVTENSMDDSMEAGADAEAVRQDGMEALTTEQAE